LGAVHPWNRGRPSSAPDGDEAQRPRDSASGTGVRTRASAVPGRLLLFSLFRLAVLAGFLRGYGVGALQPAGEVYIGAAPGAERAEAHVARLAADGAFACFRGARRHRSLRGRIRSALRS